MSHFAELETTLIALSGLIFIAIVGKRAGWFKIIGGTNALLKEQNTQLRSNEALLKEQIATLKTQNQNDFDRHEQDKSDWAARHTESLNEIAKLQGKVETLTALPLDKIDATLREFTSFGERFVESNNRILETLEKSAGILAKDTKAAADAVAAVKDIAAEDREVLTDQNLHIRTEVHKEMEKNKP